MGINSSRATQTREEVVLRTTRSASPRLKPGVSCAIHDDWNWRDGKFRYYAGAGEVRDIVVVYAAEEVQSVMRFDPMTGKALVVQS